VHVVTATCTAAEGKADELQALLTGMLEPTRSEPGCHTYVLHRAVDDPSTFMVYEVYEATSAFEAHTKTPHFADLLAKLPDLVQGQPTLVHFEPLG
jgi:quinol monooxygenase YgiN